MGYIHNCNDNFLVYVSDHSYYLEDCSDIDHQNKHVPAQSLMGSSFSIKDRAATWILKVQEQYKIPQSTTEAILGDINYLTQVHCTCRL